MIKIKEIEKVQEGDFVNYKGTLSIIKTIEIIGQTVFMTLENGRMIEESTDARIEFFRILVRHRIT